MEALLETMTGRTTAISGDRCVPEPIGCGGPATEFRDALSPILTLDELRGLPTPEPTKTHRPIPHFDVARVLLEEGNRSPLRVDCERLELRGSVLGDRMDCSLVWRVPGRTWCPGVVVSHANNKRRSLRVNIGLLVEICENGLVVPRGEQVGFRRRHVPGNAWDQLIREYVGSMDTTILGLEKMMSTLRGIHVPDGLRRIRGWQDEGWLPKRAADRTFSSWIIRRTGNFPDADAWCLYNHLNESIKRYTPRRQSELLQASLDKCLAISQYN
jgi:hypothetical protein